MHAAYAYHQPDKLDELFAEPEPVQEMIGGGKPGAFVRSKLRVLHGGRHG